MLDITQPSIVVPGIFVEPAADRRLAQGQLPLHGIADGLVLSLRGAGDRHEDVRDDDVPGRRPGLAGAQPLRDLVGGIGQLYLEDMAAPEALRKQPQRRRDAQRFVEVVIDDENATTLWLW